MKASACPFSGGPEPGTGAGVAKSFFCFAIFFSYSILLWFSVFFLSFALLLVDSSLLYSYLLSPVEKASTAPLFYPVFSHRLPWKHLSPAFWCRLVIPPLWRLRQKDHKFEATVRSCNKNTFGILLYFLLICFLIKS
jgi:hypothetical protein